MTEAVTPRQGRTHYFILIAVVVAAGLSQGLLLPVLAIFLERMGISSSMNGYRGGKRFWQPPAVQEFGERLDNQENEER